MALSWLRTRKDHDHVEGKFEQTICLQNTLLKIIPALHTLTNSLDKLDLGVQEGYGLFKDGKIVELTMNRLAIYTKPEYAQRIMEIFNGRKKTKPIDEIKKVRVSLQKGIEVLYLTPELEISGSFQLSLKEYDVFNCC